LSYRDILSEITNSFDLSLSSPIQQVSTQYSDNNNNSNSVIDLFFLQSNSTELNSYEIHPELQHPSNHVSLTINIIIDEEFIQVKRYTIVKNSKEESNFISDFIKNFRIMKTSNISDKKSLDCIVQDYVNLVNSTWFKYSHMVNIMR